MFEDPTVKAAATRAGEVVLASVLELPAATETKMPALIAEFTALSRVVSAPPPRDIEMIEGILLELYWLMTQLMPAAMPEVLPEPESSKILTAMTLALREIP